MKICEMLFKNGKLLFENTHQTPLTNLLLYFINFFCCVSIYFRFVVVWACLV